MEEMIGEGLKALGIEAPTGAEAILRTYAERVLEQNESTNLTAIRTPEEAARLHILDSAALLTCEDFHGKTVIDVGTGAGFPGVPLALLIPDLQLTAVDSVGKKAEFVREACRDLGIPAEILWGRAEELTDRRESYDIAVSRAVAELNVLAELCLPLVRVGGVFLAMKGPDCGEEAEKAAPAIHALGGELREISRYTIPGTDIVHAVAIIGKIRPTPSRYPRRYAQIKKRPLA